jgi:putative transposase
MPDNKWARLLAYVTGLVNQKLLLQNEYLIAENRILRAYIPARIRLSDPERSTWLRSANASVALRSSK